MSKGVTLSELGKAIRILRVNLNLYQNEMADKIRFTPSYLSAIELGRKKPPANFADILAFHYPQVLENKKHYEVLTDMARGEVVVPLDNTSYEDIELLTTLANKFASLPAEVKSQLIEMLK